MADELIFYNGKFTKDEIYKHFIFDRGLHFGDSVYEVIKYDRGILICFDDHMDRMERGLKELKIRNPLKRDEWREVCMKLAKELNEEECSIYIQVTRGSKQRKHTFDSEINPNFLAFAQKIEKLEDFYNVILFPEIRWKRVDIKTTNLLPNVLAKTYAKSRGFDEAVFFDKKGKITEGTSTNVFIKKEEVYFTPKLNGILPGITRKRFIEFLKKENKKIFETEIFIWDLFNSDAFYVVGTTTELKVVRSINGVEIKIADNFLSLKEKFLKYLIEVSQ